MRKPPKLKNGCLRGGLYAIAIVVVFNFVMCWYQTRPAQMLKRFLDVEMSPSITRVETDYTGGMDYTALIYVECAPDVVTSIIDNRGFTLQDGIVESHTRNQLEFNGAPGIKDQHLLFYMRHHGTVIEYLVVTDDLSKFWYGALDY